MTDEGIQIDLEPGEGAIVFGEDGIKLFAPTILEDMPFEVRDTMEFVTFALLKTDWIIEYYEHLSTADALLDLMGNKHTEPPQLRLIKGGLYGESDKEEDENES